MPSLWPARSGIADLARACLLVAAFSARQIARSAVAAGYDVLAVDFFNDRDLAPLCLASESLPAAYPDGFSGPALLDALKRLAGGNRPLGLVYGAGFEDRPDLLAEIARHWPVLGNDAATVRRIKDPIIFAGACAAAGVPHPETRMTAPADRGGWLAKRQGGAGGGHVVPAGSLPDASGHYFQRIVPGERLSLGFVAHGARIDSLGITRQWSDPVSGAPYRYGGAVGPLDLGVEPRLVAAVEGVLGRIPLFGIGSADFVVDDTVATLLELNPRPGATLDVHDTPDDPLLVHHLAAVAGLASRRPPRRPGIRASGLAWAGEAGTVDPAFAWPDWAADLPWPGAQLGAGDPLCTVCVHDGVHDGSEEDARRVFDSRQAHLLSCLRRDAA